MSERSPKKKGHHSPRSVRLRSVEEARETDEPELSPGTLSCPMLTGLGKDRHVQLRSRIVFLARFAPQNKLLHPPPDDFDPFRTVAILSHCLRTMAVFIPLFCYRVRIYHRSLKQLLVWVRRLHGERDDLVEEVLKKWLQIEQQRKLTESVSHNDQHGSPRTAPIETRKEAILMIYDQKRSAFRKSFRENQDYLHQKQKELASISGLLKQGSFNEVYEEVQLRSRQATLIKEVRQLYHDQPRFCIKVSDFPITELNRNLRILTINPASSMGSSGFSSSVLNSSYIPTTSSIISDSFPQLHLSVPCSPTSPKQKSPRSPVSPISSRSKPSFPTLDTCPSSRSTHGRSGEDSSKSSGCHVSNGGTPTSPTRNIVRNHGAGFSEPLPHLSPKGGKH